MLSVLVRFSAMADVATPGMAVTYVWSTGEHAPATIVGPSTGGDGCFHVKYMRNGHELEHHAPMDRVLFAIRSPSSKPSEASPARGGSGKHVRLFKMRRKVGNPQLLMLLTGSEDLHNMLKFACT